MQGAALSFQSLADNTQFLQSKRVGQEAASRGGNFRSGGGQGDGGRSQSAAAASSA